MSNGKLILVPYSSNCLIISLNYILYRKIRASKHAKYAKTKPKQPVFRHFSGREGNSANEWVKYSCYANCLQINKKAVTDFSVTASFSK